LTVFWIIFAVAWLFACEERRYMAQYKTDVDPKPGSTRNHHDGEAKMMPEQRDRIGEHAGARHRLRILIVDDHPGTQRAVTLVLRWLGCSADLAGDGGEAVEAARARRYDVILMDVGMPTMDGLEATRRIRAEQGAGSGPWIVGTSADSSPEDRAICRAVGMDDFLPKPMDVDDLVQILDGVAPRRATAGGVANSI
jgi:CheY-like chemotaxis protein